MFQNSITRITFNILFMEWAPTHTPFCIEINFEYFQYMHASKIRETDEFQRNEYIIYIEPFILFQQVCFYYCSIPRKHKYQNAVVSYSVFCTTQGWTMKTKLLFGTPCEAPSFRIFPLFPNCGIFILREITYLWMVSLQVGPNWTLWFESSIIDRWKPRANFH